MPQHTRKRTLAAATGAGWVQPYGTNPFVFYADGGDGGNGDPAGDPKGDDPKAGDGQPQGDPAPDPKPGDGDGDEPLGEVGKKALESERAARKDADRKVTDLEAEVSRLRRANAATKGTDVEALTKEIRDTVTADSNARLIRAEVKAAAAGLLADPADAPRFIDLSALKIGEDGEVDAKAVKKAIDALLKDKPYLGATTTQWGDVGGGHREAPSGDVEPGMDRIRYAYATESPNKK